MSESATLSTAPLANPGLDYELLKREGTRLVQQLAGEVWTDYNEHDPGVTTLEQLCYALTELSYRAELPLQDLLVDPETGRIDPHRQALFIPARALPVNPVTVDDYRKLLLDRVAGLGNVWVVPCDKAETGGIDGFYAILLYLPRIAICPGDPGVDPATAMEEVSRVYHAHRNLCEDLYSVRVLEAWPVAVAAEVTLQGAANPDETMALLLFRLALCLAPEPPRHSLRRQLEQGESAATLFEGPLLEHGFIDGDDLLPLATAIGRQELIRIAASTAGVTGVRNLRVCTPEAESPCSEADCIPIPKRHIPRLDTRPGPRGDYPIRLFRNGLECRLDPARVDRALERLWAEQRRRHPLEIEYEEYFGFPEGRARRVAEYYSIQNQFPACYGINGYGLPGEAGPLRRGQAHQFKGYLLVFEQLMADYLEQLARLRDLYSLEPRLPCAPAAAEAAAEPEERGQCTYFYQYLDRSVPNVEPLLKEAGDGSGYHLGLAKIVRSQDPGTARRNRFLGFLLALYAETLGDGEVSGADCDGAEGEHAPERTLMRARLALLQRLVESTHDRARGIDYLAPPGRRNIAGMTIKSRIQLDLADADEAPLDDLLEPLDLQLVEHEEQANFGVPLKRNQSLIEKGFVPIGQLPEFTAAAVVAGERPVGSPLAGRRVTEGLLAACSDPANLRVGSLPSIDGVIVVGRAPEESDWRLLGRYPDTHAACAGMRALLAWLRSLNRHRRRLYIVEHNLLRFAGDHHHHHHHHHHRADFEYSLTLTAVTSSHPDDGPEVYDEVWGIIRENTPAHLVSELCLLNLWQMWIFEGRYWAWRDALLGQEPGRMARTSARLRDFLQRCRRGHWRR